MHDLLAPDLALNPNADLGYSSRRSRSVVWELLDIPGCPVILKTSALGESKPTARRAGWCVRPGRTVRPRVKSENQSKNDQRQLELIGSEHPELFEAVVTLTTGTRETADEERTVKAVAKLRDRVALSRVLT